MNRENLLKYGLFIALVVLGVLADQWTKQVATDRLATTRYGQFTHSIHLTVPAAYEGKKVTTYLADEFTRNSPEEIETIAKRYTLLESKGLRLKPDSKLKTGQKLQIKRRKVVVIPGYFDFEYARNPGAAFSFLAEADDSFRRPFFIGVGILAFLVILWLLHGVEAGQWAMVWGLGLIASGAMGNFIDRVRLEYVVDFILWKYTDQYRWPVFNIADSLICVGVALMLLVLLRDAYQEWREKNSPAPEVTIVEAEAGADSAADEADASTETPPLEEAGA